MRSPPRGYVGTDHETIGSDILAVPHALKELSQHGRLGPRALLDQLLGTEAVKRLADVEPTSWYPIAWLLEMTEALDGRLGLFGLRRVGRTLFELSHAASVRAQARCGLDIVHGIDGMYHHANRGQDIGGWGVLAVSDSRALLEKTTPHHCAMEEGILLEAMATVDCRVIVTQEACIRRGGGVCLFAIECMGGTWEPPSRASPR